MDLSIIIPCYNEIENVPKLRDEFFPIVARMIKTRSVEVIFVDDGSVDGTGDALADTFGEGSEFGVAVRIERHNPNQGLGAAIRTGFAASGGDVIITTDCDGTYRFSEIPTLLFYLTPEVDIVTASPYHPAGDVNDVPGYRLVLSRGSSTLYRLLASREVHTYTALFRAYRRRVIENVPFESNGFLAGTELMVNAMRMGYRVAEYPTVLHSRVLGESKAKLARTVQAHLNFQVRVLLPWHPYGTVIQGSDDCVYLYLDGQKRLFPSAEIFLSHGYHWDQIVQVNDSYLAGLPDGPPITFRNGTLVRGFEDTVYIIEHGKKRAILSGWDFKDLGYRWNDIMIIPDNDLDRLETGPTLSIMDKLPDGTLVKSPAADFVYLLDNGQKRWFPSPQVFLSWGYKWDRIVTIREDELARYPTGDPMTPQPSFYLQNIQDAIKTNLRLDEETPNSVLKMWPQLIDGIANKLHLSDIPAYHVGKKVLRGVR